MEATGTDVPAAIDSFADVSSSKFDPQTYCARSTFPVAARESLILIWPQVSMTPLMKGNIELARYDRPTPVQKNSIPVITARLASCVTINNGSGSYK